MTPSRVTESLSVYFGFGCVYVEKLVAHIYHSSYHKYWAIRGSVRQQDATSPSLTSTTAHRLFALFTFFFISLFLALWNHQLFPPSVTWYQITDKDRRPQSCCFCQMMLACVYSSEFLLADKWRTHKWTQLYTLIPPFLNTQSENIKVPKHFNHRHLF